MSELPHEFIPPRLQSFTARECIHCNRYADAWVHDSDLGGHLCEPCAEEEYGLPAEEWYGQRADR